MDTHQGISPQTQGPIELPLIHSQLGLSCDYHCLFSQSPGSLSTDQVQQFIAYISSHLYHQGPETSEIQTIP
ncbi:hypothetical protein PanWU01x14_187220, partial [Parasponia andersonii]